MKINIYNNPNNPIDVKKENIIQFDYGLPGFEDLKKFTIVNIEEYNPFLLLHSIEDHNIAMIVLNAGLINLEDDIKIPESKLKELNKCFLCLNLILDMLMVL